MGAINEFRVGGAKCAHVTEVPKGKTAPFESGTELSRQLGNVFIVSGFTHSVVHARRIRGHEANDKSSFRSAHFEKANSLRDSGLCRLGCRFESTSTIRDPRERILKLAVRRLASV